MPDSRTSALTSTLSVTFDAGQLTSGGWVCEQTLALSLHLVSSHPGKPLWHLPAARFKLHE